MTDYIHPCFAPACRRNCPKENKMTAKEQIVALLDEVANTYSRSTYLEVLGDLQVIIDDRIEELDPDEDY